MDPLVLTALVVSLVALITTLLQVLQQYLASAADGYRRCKASVMGRWAKYTRRGFNPDELRFEIRFKAPVIFLAHPGNRQGPIAGHIYDVDGTPDSYEATDTMSLKDEMAARVARGISITASAIIFETLPNYPFR